MNKKYYFLLMLACFVMQVSVRAQMKIGTNLSFRADWTDELPWNTGVDFAECWNSGQTNRIVNTSPWNPDFLEDQKPYSVIRFMNWNHTNGSQDTTWEERRLPADIVQDALSGGGKDDFKGVAYEWMIDLVNRLNCDIWLNIPHPADDNYVRQLATLVRDNLNPGLKCYIEHSNEVWNNNLTVQYNYCVAKGKELNLGGSTDYETGQKYHVYRSTQIWTIWAEVFGQEMDDRIVKVLAGKSTDPGTTANIHYPALLNPSINPDGIMPDAYGIAPYFGGNGLSGTSSGIFDLLRTDIFVHRATSPETSSRLANVKEHYNFLKGKNIDLIAYEGGQHLTINAIAPNRDPEMYNVYTEYLEALDDYMPLFAHYITVNTFAENNCFGAKEYTGQPMSEAHKYRALFDYIKETDERFKKLDVINGTGSDFYMPGEQVNISANQPEAGKCFLKWVGDIGVLSNYLSSNTSLIMPDSNVAVAAIYVDKNKVIPVNVINGSGSGKYLADNYVQITANDPPEGKIFSKWIGDTEHLSDTAAFSTAVLVPADSISIEAVFTNDTSIRTYKFLKFTLVKEAVAGTEPRLTELSWISEGVNYPIHALEGADTAKIVADPAIGYPFRLYDLTTSTGFSKFPLLSLPLSITINMGDSPILPDAMSLSLPSANSRGAGEFICEGSNDSINFEVIYHEKNLTSDDYVANSANVFPFNKEEPSKYTLTITNGGGSGSYAIGSRITIFALNIPGKQFDHWSGDVSYLEDEESPVTKLTMPEQTVNIEAVYTDVAVPAYELIVNSGEGSGSYPEETLINIVADDIRHQVFQGWTGDVEFINKASEMSSWIIMPSENVELTATYIAEPQYILTVTSGTGSGSYYLGDTIAIQANEPADNYEFTVWSGNIAYILDINTPTTKVVMPGQNVTVEAEYAHLSNNLSQVDKNIRVYPVPARDVLYVDGFDNDAPFKVCDFQGRTILNGSLSRNSINISGLKPGLYVLMLNVPQTNRYLFIKE